MKKKRFVKCDVCENFASRNLSEAVRWNACPVCVFGEAALLSDPDYQDFYTDHDYNATPEPHAQ